MNISKLKNNLKKISLVSILLFSTKLMAQIQFNSMGQDDVDILVQDLASGFSHTSIGPASSLGSVFGFELAAYGGTTEAKGVTQLSREVDATSSEVLLPHAGFLLGVSVPFGVTFELNYLPSFDTDGASFDTGSFGVKWTMTQGLFTLPFDLALRVSQSTLDMSVTQVVSGATGRYNISTKNLATMLLVSKSFFILEPYIGFGTVSISGDVDFTATASDQGFTFTSGNSANSKKSGTQYVAGAQLNLLFLNIGVETGKVVDGTRTSFKLGFQF